MSVIAKPYTFSPNTTASSSQVNSNFDTLYNDYNGGISAANLATDAVTTAKIADSNVTAAKIVDAAITPAKLLAGTGTTWVWQTWSPTLTNLSGGSQTYAKYIQIGKTVIFRFEYTLAGAGVAGTVSFTLPVTASTSSRQILSNVLLVDTGTGTSYGTIILGSTTSAGIRVSTASGTYVSDANLSSTVPHTWANTDVIQCWGIYEAA